MMKKHILFITLFYMLVLTTQASENKTRGLQSLLLLLMLKRNEKKYMKIQMKLR